MRFLLHSWINTDGSVCGDSCAVVIAISHIFIGELLVWRRLLSYFTLCASKGVLRVVCFCVQVLPSANVKCLKQINNNLFICIHCVQEVSLFFRSLSTDQIYIWFMPTECGYFSTKTSIFYTVQVYTVCVRTAWLKISISNYLHYIILLYQKNYVIPPVASSIVHCFYYYYYYFYAFYTCLMTHFRWWRQII